jgi:rod shape-determining protein MreD
MRAVKPVNYFLMIVTMVAGIFLTIIPLPVWAIWLRPQFLLAILLFWVITAPARCGIILAWIVGITTDLIVGTPLCEHAIIFVLLTYIVLKTHSAIVHFPLAQQAVVIAILCLLSTILQGILLDIAGHSTHIMSYALSAVTTAMIWPWLYRSLDKICFSRVGIYHR